MTKPPSWYYAIVGLATLWALMGCYAYLSQVSMGPAELAQLPTQQREIWAMFPTWLTGVYAMAVWAGLAAAICLLLRLKFARTAYIVSLIAVVIQFGWIFLATPIISTMGFVDAAAFPIFIAVVGAALIWFANHAIARDWLR